MLISAPDGNVDDATDELLAELALMRTIAVIMCVYARVPRLPDTLEQLRNQQGTIARLHLWNNNWSARSVVDEVVASYQEVVATVYHSPRNVGGFARFHAARALGDNDKYVVFIDDDVVLSATALQTLTTEASPKSISSFFAFRFRTRRDYYNRQELKAGEIADYCGTGGMIADVSLFRDQRLYDCPQEYWFIEDLWMSYFASHVRGWRLTKSGADIQLHSDEVDQWRRLGDRKTEFLQYLVRQGWTVPPSFWASPAARAKLSADATWTTARLRTLTLAKRVRRRARTTIR